MTEEVSIEQVRQAVQQLKKNKSSLIGRIHSLISTFELENGVKVIELNFDETTGNVSLSVDI
jgi:hypothetical protein